MAPYFVKIKNNLQTNVALLVKLSKADCIYVLLLHFSRAAGAGRLFLLRKCFNFWCVIKLGAGVGALLKATPLTAPFHLISDWLKYLPFSQGFIQ